MNFLSDNEDVVSVFINRGADITAKTVTDNTPLHLAVTEGEFYDFYKKKLNFIWSNFEIDMDNIVRLLLSKGAAINATNSDRNTPLHFAAMKGSNKR